MVVQRDTEVPALAEKLFKAQPWRLTFRECEIVLLLMEGARNKEIAAGLVLSENTVKTHIQRIMSKMLVDSRTEVVVAAMRLLAPTGQTAEVVPSPVQKQSADVLTAEQRAVLSGVLEGRRIEEVAEQRGLSVERASELALGLCRLFGARSLQHLIVQFWRRDRRDLVSVIEDLKGAERCWCPPGQGKGHTLACVAAQRATQGRN